jgi:hypothetical protein
MNQRHLWILGAGLCVGLAGGPAVQAQYARALDSLLNRPTTNAPSQLIGGQYTRRATRQLESTQGSNVYMFGQRPLPSRADMGDYAHGKTLGLTDVGVVSTFDSLAGGSYVNLMARALRDRSGDIGTISGLNRAMSINLPLPGENLGAVPSLGACAYTPRPQTNRFEDLLGLLPAPPEGPCEIAPSIAERLEDRSSLRAAQAAAAGVALFKEGTQELPDPDTLEYRKCPDCPSKLGHAVAVLRMANDLDAESGLPSLLIAHAALGQARPLLASSALLEALHRDPNLFTRPSRTLDSYFGDVQREGERSAVLTAQMRVYARLGDYNPTSPQAFALQAYCAWRLGDVVSARAALGKLDELLPSADDLSAADLHGFASALRDAMP